MNFDAEAIAVATAGQVVRGAGDGPILTDSRSFPAGAWFLALVGPRFDGHQFVGAVRDAGCVGVIGNGSPPDGWDRGWVRVDDTVAAYQALGGAARDRLAGPVIGVTGSAGKTTTRTFCALALAPLGLVHQTVANLNNHLGVPMTLLAAPPRAAACVVEMGTSAPGEILALAQVARPDVRLIVNVGAAHLEELGGLEGVAFEKGALFRSARPGDTLCVNLDDPYVVGIERPAGARVVTWGSGPGCDVRLLAVSLDPDRLVSRASFDVLGRRVVAELPVFGRHLALNAAGALAVAAACGVDAEAAAAGLSAYEPVGMRMRREEIGGVTVFNDAYNANPLSTRASVDALSSLPGRRAVVLGDMLELGVDEGKLHREIVAHAASSGVDLLLVVGPRMAAAAGDVGGVWAGTAAEAAERLARWLAPGDRVLVKGSRGMRMEQVIDGLRAALRLPEDRG